MANSRKRKVLYYTFCGCQASIYNPIKDYEKLVLTAINIGTTAMNKASEVELKEAIMSFVSEYGMLGLMTALPTTPDFITYEQSICQRIIYQGRKHLYREVSVLLFPF